jgi:hypothetical protein
MPASSQGRQEGQGEARAAQRSRTHASSSGLASAQVRSLGGKATPS